MVVLATIRGITTASKMQSTRILLLLFIHTTAALTSEKTYQNAIKFLYFNERFEFVDRVTCVPIFYNKITWESVFSFLCRNESIFQPNTSAINTQCKVGENIKLAVIIHGWMESCGTIWVTTLMQSERNFVINWKSFNELIILRFK